MLSPYDQVRILEEEEKKRLAAEALANANRPVKKGPPKKEDITKKIELQGIVSGEDGNKAIVNGDLVGVGELILGKVKIVRITQAGVVFDYQGKKFTKSVSQD
ncbi:MAG: general secretion pathway protein GspB [Elusimicrobiota bacterium]|nr:MAG: general secretion pathway protein GspB [Elusimicrobiota bacterium]